MSGNKYREHELVPIWEHGNRSQRQKKVLNSWIYGIAVCEKIIILFRTLKGKIIWTEKPVFRTMFYMLTQTYMKQQMMKRKVTSLK